jgi:hypothetical protein
MKAVQTKIGSAAVLIEMTDEPLEIYGQTQEGRKTQTTGVADQLKDSYDKAKTVIKEIAEDIGQQLTILSAGSRPKQVDVEFGLSLSASAGVWVVTGKGECALKVKMSWEFK